MRQISFVARLGEAIDDAYALQLGFRGGPELGDDGLDVALWGGMGNLGVHVVGLPRGALIGIVPCALFSAEGVRFAAKPLILLAQVLDIPGGLCGSLCWLWGELLELRIAASVAVRSNAMPGVVTLDVRGMSRSISDEITSESFDA